MDDRRRFGGLATRIEIRESDDPWRGRKRPRYEKLVYGGPGHFELVARLASGERISVRLGPLR
jgi:hypothetical protein